MATFVLVHGSWHGAWCWQLLIPMLEAYGHRVYAPDLPGHGADQTPVAAISQDSYVTTVTDLLDAIAEPVVLVGHSMGGMVISQAAERRPDAIAALVYLAAFLLDDGQSVFEVGTDDPQSHLLPHLRPNEAAGVLMLEMDGIADVFYNNCPPDVAAWAVPHLRPDPLLPVGTPIHVTAGNFGRIPRTYIECRRDQTLSFENQRKMTARNHGGAIISLDTDHSPMLSMPAVLAQQLDAVAWIHLARRSQPV